MPSETGFEAALTAIDAVHATDPKRVTCEGRSVPYAPVYAEAMTRWLRRLDPTASEALQLAVRAQHIGRWTIPRDRYPAGTAGYYRWRRDLARFHADTVGRILAEAGYDRAVIDRVGALVRKEGLGRDPETQLLEDAACLAFLELEFEDFSRRHPDDQVVDILKKTWRKMGPRGRSLARELTGTLAPDRRQLVARAVAAAEGP